MTFTEYLDEILDGLSEKGTFGLKDINEIIINADYRKIDESGEIVDFSNGANTFLYSGKLGGGVKTQDYVCSIQNARIIDRSCAGKLLNNGEFNKYVVDAIQNDILAGNFDPETVRKGFRDPNDYLEFLDDVKSATPATVEIAAEKAALAYQYEPKQGMWAIASKEFIKNTPPDSHILCVTPDADTSRTWGQVEVITALDELPDTQKIEGTTVGELKKLVHDGEIDINKKYGDVWNELKNEAQVYDDILTRSGGDVNNSGKILTATKGDSAGAVKVLEATGNDVNGSVKLIDASSGDVDGAIQVLNRSSKDIDTAADIINRSGKNTAKALDVIKVANTCEKLTYGLKNEDYAEVA